MTIEIDGRELDPPEPLQRVLAALDVLAEGEEVRVLLYCHPRPLISVLRNNGFAWQEEIHPDGTHELRIRRAAP